MKTDTYLKKLYANRFDSRQMQAKVALWKVLIDEFLQDYVPPESAVLDIGGGYCEFINQIRAGEKCLIDLNPDSKLFADADVKVLNIDVLNLDKHTSFSQQFDRIFISNFFEHLRNKEELIQIISFCFEALKPEGSLLVIQPNFKYSFKEYYDFIDHQLPITHLSLQELLQTVGFEIDLIIPRFLPFSTKGRPASPLMLKIYLKLPFLWRFLGGQMFVKASKRNN
ncbi:MULTISPECIES: methyltransferase domain-containing protein [unclassified Microcoleus]|uniref:class I SAM-dependent methyltransferase n=1 Tax=unclassified Microcoleus TaxID=2642155 RepID=UPI001D4B52B5|nr:MULTISPECIES: methyltransferase domain-containing protein [unclassified Microcoleus]TAG76214.1 MAG: methyltransferase [Oscillatoriales cyanobacterium]MCC3471246.1 methyltransferase [Microcoleus sp. PH2017_13_LAR_U_A]MCC3483900.1 methyltransferase [Microcoleus sp. PH2017_14_LAR_D_A]MCC3569021.1 methyltransferase [Microcoleus sp. PH2017_31_RDM_U_A]MCC3581348.1 methyltransferase [Microcoleus sp. PH2017_32_RDM_D_A]